MHVTAIVVAAGAGRRIGDTLPKPYLVLAGRAMILYTLDRCFGARSIDDVILVVARNEVTRCEALLKADSFLNDRPWRLQKGGETRQESVRCGLEAMNEETEIVVIHDGARPLVSPGLIDRCVAVACEKGAAIAGVPVRDTIKIVSGDHRVRSTPERSSLWEIQTPQVFRRDLIVDGHKRAAREEIHANDDAMLIERMGGSVFVVEGERSNLKITVPEDILFAEALIQRSRSA
jgi:2-C-methyl-D-erythritol 4-phosphate cytidylyltransferase